VKARSGRETNRVFMEKSRGGTQRKTPTRKKWKKTKNGFKGKERWHRREDHCINIVDRTSEGNGTRTGPPKKSHVGGENLQNARRAQFHILAQLTSQREGRAGGERPGAGVAGEAARSALTIVSKNWGLKERFFHVSKARLAVCRKTNKSKSNAQRNQNRKKRLKNLEKGFRTSKTTRGDCRTKRVKRKWGACGTVTVARSQRENGGSTTSVVTKKSSLITDSSE